MLPLDLMTEMPVAGCSRLVVDRLRSCGVGTRDGAIVLRLLDQLNVLGGPANKESVFVNILGF